MFAICFPDAGLDAGEPRCPPGDTWCAPSDAGLGVCVDTEIDRNSCGGCVGEGGLVCPPDQLCLSGTCACPSATPDWCDAECTNASIDPDNCGGCAGHGGQVCLSSQVCHGGACGCGGTKPNLCGSTCTNTNTDSANCGMCDATCCDGTMCINGVCTGPGGFTCPPSSDAG